MAIKKIKAEDWPGRTGPGRWAGPGMAARLAFWEEVKAAKPGTCWEIPAGSVEFPGALRSAQQWLSTAARKDEVVIQTARLDGTLYVRRG